MIRRRRYALVVGAFPNLDSLRCTIEGCDPHGQERPTCEHQLAGASVKIHTARGANTRTDLYWRQGNYVWNNDGDKAILKNAAGVRIDTCKWGSSGSGATNC